MPKRRVHYFTQQEVNALIPRLEEHFQRFWGFRENAQRIMEDLRAKAKAARDLEDMTPKEAALHQMRSSQAHFLLEQAKKEMDQVLDLGCSVKDLEMGLVDFPHIQEVEEQEVFLCWKFGEKRIRFWHELDQGFHSRKPITKRVPHH